MSKTVLCKMFHLVCEPLQYNKHNKLLLVDFNTIALMAEHSQLQTTDL